MKQTVVSESSRMDSTKCAEEIVDIILEQVENEARDEVEILDEVPFGDSEQNNVIVVDSTEEDGKKIEKSTYEDNGGVDKELFVDEQSEMVGEREEQRGLCNAVQDLVFEKIDAKLPEGAADERTTNVRCGLQNEVLEFSSSREQTDVNGGEIEEDDAEEYITPDEMLTEQSPDKKNDDDTNVDTCNAVQDLVFEKIDAKRPEGEANEQTTNTHCGLQNEVLEFFSSREQTDVIGGEIEEDDVNEYITPDEMLPEQSPDKKDDDDTNVDSCKAVEDLVSEKKDVKLPEGEADERTTNVHCGLTNEDLEFASQEQADVIGGEIEEDDAPDEMLPEQSPDQKDDDDTNVDTCNAVEDVVSEKDAKLPEVEADEQTTNVHCGLTNEDLEFSSQEQTDVIGGDIQEDDVRECSTPDEMLPEQSPDHDDDADDDTNVNICNVVEDQVFEKDAELREDEAADEQITNVHCNSQNKDLKSSLDEQTDVTGGEIEEVDVKEYVTPDEMLPEQSPGQNEDDDTNVDTCNAVQDLVSEKKDAKPPKDEGDEQITNIHCGLQNENLKCSSDEQTNVIGGEIEQHDVKEYIAADEQSPDKNDGDDRTNVDTLSGKVSVIIDEENAVEAEEESLYTEKDEGKDHENVLELNEEPKKNDCIFNEENPPVEEESKLESNETSDVCSSELPTLEDQIECEGEQSSKTIEHEGISTRGCEEEALDNVEVSVDAKEMQSGEIGDDYNNRSNGFLGETKESDGDIICCVGTNRDIDVTEETSSRTVENLSSCEENEIKPALEKDASGDSPEQAILDALVGEVVSHEEILSDGNVDDFDID